MDIEAIKQDLIELCKKHRITMHADEDEPFVFVAADADVETWFGFTFVSEEKLLQW